MEILAVDAVLESGPLMYRAVKKIRAAWKASETMPSDYEDLENLLALSADGFEKAMALIIAEATGKTLSGSLKIVRKGDFVELDGLEGTEFLKRVMVGFQKKAESIIARYGEATPGVEGGTEGEVVNNDDEVEDVGGDSGDKESAGDALGPGEKKGKRIPKIFSLGNRSESSIPVSSTSTVLGSSASLLDIGIPGASLLKGGALAHKKAQVSIASLKGGIKDTTKAGTKKVVDTARALSLSIDRDRILKDVDCLDGMTDKINRYRILSEKCREASGPSGSHRGVGMSDSSAKNRKKGKKAKKGPKNMASSDDNDDSRDTSDGGDEEEEEEIMESDEEKKAKEKEEEKEDTDLDE
ncbi:hypothetical protein BJ508DRAFT_342537 [Ascobolus immersus RN42]|uniref:Uncharacterized protein n=1 Tax=Ascobolus immersus RN42 TaxID=1160509 RepID=A0A3N4IQY9_ASCIM|nr:hypothetical protein BJ508DRAFT_342537 [Ascobolus immersus RN42]